MHITPTKKNPISTALKIAGLSALVICLGLVALLEIQTRSQFAKVNDALENVRTSAIAPAQGTEQTERAYAKGEGIFSTLSCLPDVHCPIAQRTWLITIGSNQEQTFGKRLLEQSGYVITKQDGSCVPADGKDCYFDGSNSETNMKVTLKRAGATQLQVVVGVELK